MDGNTIICKAKSRGQLPSGQWVDAESPAFEIPAHMKGRWMEEVAPDAPTEPTEPTEPKSKAKGSPAK